MFINSILLALCVSIDSLGIGITYGIKNTKISFSSGSILFLICLIITSISVSIGNYISNIFSPSISKNIGAIFLCILGFWILLQSLIDNKKQYKKKECHFFINFLGITIKIIKNANCSDINNSNKIEAKEAIYLGTALSLDSVGIGISSSIIGMNSFFFPFFAAIFQISFLLFGSLLGKKIRSISNIPENIWSIISGCLLIFIAINKIIFF